MKVNVVLVLAAGRRLWFEIVAAFQPYAAGILDRIGFAIRDMGAFADFTADLVGAGVGLLLGFEAFVAVLLSLLVVVLDDPGSSCRVFAHPRPRHLSLHFGLIMR